jgi:hypothetical protein
MPLVQIDMKKSANLTPKVIGDSVQRALIDALHVPDGDRFQIINCHDDEDIIYDDSFLGIQRSDGLVLIQITLAEGRDITTKKHLYSAIASRLTDECGVRTEDVFVTLHETTTANFSFGNGMAQFADKLPAHLKPSR